MRLWSIHPKYLDRQGLVACWRESLLAQSVLLKGEYNNGKKTAYWNHPQLIRFKKCKYALRAIGNYLTELWQESENRNYKFKANKIIYFCCFQIHQLTVTNKQLEYEFKHLQNKLKTRTPVKYFENNLVENIQTNPIFTSIPGNIESWEYKKKGIK